MRPHKNLAIQKKNTVIFKKLTATVEFSFMATIKRVPRLNMYFANM